MTKKSAVAFVPVILFATFFLPGCDVNSNVDSIKTSLQRVIGGNRNAINKAEEVKTKIEDLNPVFESEEETTLSDPVAQQVDELFKKGLEPVFTDSKLVSIQNEGKTPFIIKYVVKKRIGQADGEVLYKNLIDADCRAKSDANPSFSSARNMVDFSVYHDFGGRSYILAVVLDLGEQSIWVSVY